MLGPPRNASPLFEPSFITGAVTVLIILILTRAIVIMLLYLWCLWINGIITVHAAAEHPSDQEERGALRRWRRQNVGTPTPMRTEPVEGTEEKLSGRRPPLSG